eukprot:Lankesteria_metandrocarpae@DN4054_c0_g1_i1.p1
MTCDSFHVDSVHLVCGRCVLSQSTSTVPPPVALGTLYSEINDLATERLVARAAAANSLLKPRMNMTTTSTAVAGYASAAQKTNNIAPPNVMNTSAQLNTTAGLTSNDLVFDLNSIKRNFSYTTMRSGRSSTQPLSISHTMKIDDDTVSSSSTTTATTASDPADLGKALADDLRAVDSSSLSVAGNATVVPRARVVKTSQASDYAGTPGLALRPTVAAAKTRNQMFSGILPVSSEWSAFCSHSSYGVVDPATGAEAATSKSGVHSDVWLGDSDISGLLAPIMRPPCIELLQAKDCVEVSVTVLPSSMATELIVDSRSAIRIRIKTTHDFILQSTCSVCLELLDSASSTSVNSVSAVLKGLPSPPTAHENDRDGSIVYLTFDSRTATLLSLDTEPVPTSHDSRVIPVYSTHSCGGKPTTAARPGSVTTLKFNLPYFARQCELSVPLTPRCQVNNAVHTLTPSVENHAAGLSGASYVATSDEEEREDEDDYCHGSILGSSTNIPPIREGREAIRDTHLMSLSSPKYKRPRAVSMHAFGLRHGDLAGLSPQTASSQASSTSGRPSQRPRRSAVGAQIMVRSQSASSFSSGANLSPTQRQVQPINNHVGEAPTAVSPRQTVLTAPPGRAVSIIGGPPGGGSRRRRGSHANGMRTYNNAYSPPTTDSLTVTGATEDDGPTAGHRIGYVPSRNQNLSSIILPRHARSTAAQRFSLRGEGAISVDAVSKFASVAKDQLKLFNSTDGISPRLDTQTTTTAKVEKGGDDLRVLLPVPFVGSARISYGGAVFVDIKASLMFAVPVNSGRHFSVMGPVSIGESVGDCVGPQMPRSFTSLTPCAVDILMDSSKEVKDLLIATDRHTDSTNKRLGIFAAKELCLKPVSYAEDSKIYSMNEAGERILTGVICTKTWWHSMPVRSVLIHTNRVFVLPLLSNQMHAGRKHLPSGDLGGTMVPVPRIPLSLDDTSMQMLPRGTDMKLVALCRSLSQLKIQNNPLGRAAIYLHSVVVSRTTVTDSFATASAAPQLGSNVAPLIAKFEHGNENNSQYHVVVALVPPPSPSAKGQGEEKRQYMEDEYAYLHATLLSGETFVLLVSFTHYLERDTGKDVDSINKAGSDDVSKLSAVSPRDAAKPPGRTSFVVDVLFSVHGTDTADNIGSDPLAPDADVAHGGAATMTGSHSHLPLLSQQTFSHHQASLLTGKGKKPAIRYKAGPVQAMSMNISPAAGASPPVLDSRRIAGSHGAKLFCHRIPLDVSVDPPPCCVRLVCPKIGRVGCLLDVTVSFTNILPKPIAIHHHVCLQFEDALSLSQSTVPPPLRQIKGGLFSAPSSKFQHNNNYRRAINDTHSWLMAGMKSRTTVIQGDSSFELRLQLLPLQAGSLVLPFMMIFVNLNPDNTSDSNADTWQRMWCCEAAVQGVEVLVTPKLKQNLSIQPVSFDEHTNSPVIPINSSPSS